MHLMQKKVLHKTSEVFSVSKQLSIKFIIKYKKKSRTTSPNIKVYNQSQLTIQFMPEQEKA